MMNSGKRVDFDALLRLFSCPGCGNPANQPPLFQCVKGLYMCGTTLIINMIFIDRASRGLEV